MIVHPFDDLWTFRTWRNPKKCSSVAPVTQKKIGPKRNSQRRVPSIMAMRVLAVLAFFVPAYAFVAPAGVRPVSTESVHAASYAPVIRIVWWLNVFVF